MTNILFASNNISHWPNALAGQIAGTFDANRVPYSIALDNFETIGSPTFIPSVGDTTWFHFRMFPGTANYGGSQVLLEGFDVNGVSLFSVNKRGNTTAYQVTGYLHDGNSTINADSIHSFTANKVGFIDISYTATVLGIDLKVYINGALGITLSFNTNTNSYGSPTSFTIGTAFTNNNANIQHVSEIIVADADTRNARLDLLRPLAAGAFTEWAGSLNVLADDDTTTGMTTTLAAKRQTVTLTPYAGAANISNFVIISQTTRGLNSPTKLKHTIRLGGVNYDSADITLGNPLQYNLTDYLINPATSLPWVSADLAAIETGFLSVA